MNELLEDANIAHVPGEFLARIRAFAAAADTASVTTTIVGATTIAAILILPSGIPFLSIFRSSAGEVLAEVPGRCWLPSSRRTRVSAAC